MDINANYSEEDNPLSLKADFILSLCELVVGGKEGLLPVEKTVIDRCVHLIYRKYFADPCPENMPILEDLYNALLQQDEKEAHHVATALEIYVKGSLNLFNHRTNVNVNNRIVCYDIRCPRSFSAITSTLLGSTKLIHFWNQYFIHPLTNNLKDNVNFFFISYIKIYFIVSQTVKQWLCVGVWFGITIRVVWTGVDYIANLYAYAILCVPAE